MFFSVVMVTCWVLLFGIFIFFKISGNCLLNCLNEGVRFCYNFVSFLVFPFSVFYYLHEKYSRNMRTYHALTFPFFDMDYCFFIIFK